MIPVIVGAVSAVLALTAAMGVGYKLGRSECAGQIAQWRGTLETGRVHAEAAIADAVNAQRQINELAAQIRTAVDSPQIVYLDREVREPGPPLPNGACADARWGRMFNSLTGAKPKRTATAPTRAAGAADAVAAAAPDPAGYVSAGAFRDWAADAARQYREAVKRDRDWCQFVQQIPGIEPFSCTQGGVPP
jgi:hypothetical protein